MHFTLSLPFMSHPQKPEFLSQEAVAEVARAAETAGFDAVAVTEHPIPSDPWLESGGHDALDPFVALAFAAAATSRIRLLTNLTVVPYRNPFLLAKSAASLDRLSKGRLILGCGVGYLRGEFEALGVDFEERNALFDESLEILRATWTGETVEFRGRHFHAAGNTAHPVPAQAQIPIWIGGNSKLSRRRAVEKAQGWMPLPNPSSLKKRLGTPNVDSLDDLRELMVYMTDHARSFGRIEPIDVLFPALGGMRAGGLDFDAHRTYLDALIEVGVTWALAPVAGSSLVALTDAIADYGERIIRPYQ